MYRRSMTRSSDRVVAAGLVQWRGKGGPPRLSSGRQESKQRTNLFTRVRDCIQYARLWKKHLLDYCDRKQQKQCLLIKTTHIVVSIVVSYSSFSFMYILLCVFISQYSNKVDFISISEAQMGTKEASGVHRMLSCRGFSNARITVLWGPKGRERGWDCC